MRVVIQRVSEASVKVNQEIVGRIAAGLVVLIGVEETDSEEDLDWLFNKTLNQRIFSDGQGKMNLSLVDVDGELLLISQFTLHASTKKGNRPSFMNAAKPEVAMLFYEAAIKKLEQGLGKSIAKGIFGADMKVSLINDGPVTIIMDSKNRE